MPAKWDKFAKRAVLEYLTNGEKGFRKVALEQAVHELARHKKDDLESEGPVTEPSGQSTGVSYSAPPDVTEHRAQVLPELVLDDGGGRGSLDINGASVPLLSDIDSQDPLPPSLPVPYSEHSPEMPVPTDATNVLSLVGDVGPSLPDFLPEQPPVEQQNPVPHPEALNGGVAIDSSMISHSEPLTVSSRAMPVAEVVPSQSALATSTDVPSGSRPRRTWNSRVPSAGAVIPRSPPIGPSPGQSNPNPGDSHIDKEPSALIKVTGYRILNTTVVLMLGIWKGVASYRGESILSNTLDILMGVAFAVVLYWLGFLETSDPPCLIWLFHKDYAALLRRSLRRRLPKSRRTVPVSLPFTSHEV